MSVPAGKLKGDINGIVTGEKEKDDCEYVYTCLYGDHELRILPEMPRQTGGNDIGQIRPFKPKRQSEYSCTEIELDIVKFIFQEEGERIGDKASHSPNDIQSGDGVIC